MRATGTVVGLTALAALGGSLLAVAPPAHAASYTYEWFYTKNPNNYTDGTLQLERINDSSGGVSEIWSTRAGSGNTGGGANPYNDCTTDHGWIPNGTYSITATFADHTGAVEGPAVELSDHVCSKGTVTRTALFMHSLYPWNGQYISNGCIVMSNSGGPSNASGAVETMYQDTVKYDVKTLSVSTS